jgi:Tfp pilus assembly protein PilV
VYLQPSQRLRGSLLVEALVAFALMFTVSVVAMGLQAQSHRAKEKARSTAAATSMARQILEQAQMTGYNKLELGKSQQERFVAFGRGSVTGSSHLRATQVVSDGPLKGLKSVWVEVTWQSGRVDLEGFVSQDETP